MRLHKLVNHSYWKLGWVFPGATHGIKFSKEILVSQQRSRVHGKLLQDWVSENRMCNKIVIYNNKGLTSVQSYKTFNRGDMDSIDFIEKSLWVSYTS